MLTYSTFAKEGRLSEKLYDISDAPILVGFVSDAVIYVLANKNVRTLVGSIFRRKQIQPSNRVHNFAPTPAN